MKLLLNTYNYDGFEYIKCWSSYIIERNKLYENEMFVD